MRLRLVVILLIFSVLLGCSSSAQKVVGTWKGDVASASTADDKSKDVSEGITKSISDGLKSFVSSMIGPLTFEFNDKGRYKLTTKFASQEGSYTVSGNEVKVDSDDGKSHSIFTLSDDGKSMSSKKDFKSDDTFVLKKQTD